MIRTRLQIGDGDIKDTYDAYGLLYLSSSHILAPPIRGFESTTFAEQAGENIDARTVFDAFDYTVTFLIEAPNSDLESANSKIATFNALMYSKESNYHDILTFKTFTFYNDYKRVKIVGIPTPISEAKEFWRDSRGVQHDIVQVELKIRVSNPTFCDFNLKQNK